MGIEIEDKQALLELYYDFEKDHNKERTFNELWDAFIEELKQDWSDTKEADSEADLNDFCHEWADSHTEIYTTAIFQWYANHADRYYWAEKAIEEYGHSDEGFLKDAQIGIHYFLEQIAHQVLEEEEGKNEA